MKFLFLLQDPINEVEAIGKEGEGKLVGFASLPVDVQQSRGFATHRRYMIQPIYDTGVGRKLGRHDKSVPIPRASQTNAGFEQIPKCPMGSVNFLSLPLAKHPTNRLSGD